MAVSFSVYAFGSNATVATDPAGAYRVLDWAELVPEGWEPPLVPPAHNNAQEQGVDPAAQLSELNQQLVSIPGFMKPLVFDGDSVSEFLLVPFLPHHVKQHAHLEANQMIYVKLLEPLKVEQPFAPIWVVGTMTLDTEFTDEGYAAYSIPDAVTADYTY